MPVPRVAVGIPVYNGEKWLRFTVESIREQTFGDLDILIVDNASTDGTAAICRELEAEDARVRTLRNPSNLGVFRNYDAAFNQTASPYFKWCPVGDACDRRFVERALAVLDARDDVVLVHARAGPIGTDREVPGFDAVLDLVEDDPASRFRRYLTTVKLNNVMNGLIRRRDLAATCLNRPFHASDKCMIAELALRGKFVELPELMLFRRMDIESATALKNEDERDAFFAVEPSSPSVLWHWKVEGTLLRGIWRSPISLGRKFALSGHIGRRVLWQRSILARELRGWLVRR